MAIYHLSVKPVSRGVGRSSTAASAYRAAVRVADERTGETFDYTRKRGVEHAEILLPSATAADADWARDRQQLWNAAERAEQRKDARVAREYEVALPYELNAAQRLELVRAFAHELADRHGCAVDLAVHAPHRAGDTRNHHAHLLTTTRAVATTGLTTKTDIELKDADRAKKGLGPARTEVTAIRSTSNGTTLQLRGEAEPRRFEAAVLCSGADALSLLAPLGVRTGMVALWGYSLTAPLREGVPGPQGTVLDAARQVSLARLGQRIRVSGGAELGGTGAAQHPKALHALYEALDTWFPGSAQRGAGLQMWRGARAIRPSGLPLLGASGVPGLWLNLAHGDGGWSLASGCARELAQQLVGSESALTPTDLLHFAPSGA